MLQLHHLADLISLYTSHINTWYRIQSLA